MRDMQHSFPAALTGNCTFTWRACDAMHDVPDLQHTLHVYIYILQNPAAPNGRWAVMWLLAQQHVACDTRTLFAITNADVALG